MLVAKKKSILLILLILFDSILDEERPRAEILRGRGSVLRSVRRQLGQAPQVRSLLSYRVSLVPHPISFYDSYRSS